MALPVKLVKSHLIYPRNLCFACRPLAVLFCATYAQAGTEQKLSEVSLEKTLLKAKYHAKKGEMEEAKILYRSVLQAFPSNTRAQKGLAALTHSKKNNITLNPPLETFNKLVNLYNQGLLSAVIDQAKAITEKYPNSFAVWNVLGAASKGLGRTEDAVTAFKKVIKLNSTYADGFNNLGIVLQEQGKLDEAVEFYGKALSLKPDYPEAFYNMGNALHEQGRLDEAIEAYKSALSIKSDYAKSYNNMGNVLQEQGKLDEAISAYHKALSFKSDYAEAHKNMGDALQEQGNLDRSIAAYNKALSFKSDYAEAYNNMGGTLKEQGKLEEAIGFYNKALSIKPDLEQAYNNLGNSFKAKGDLDGALEVYKKALSINPDYAEAHRNMSSLIKYEPGENQIGKVDALLKQSNLKDADRCHLLYTFAKMNEDLGHFDVAYNNYVLGGALRKKLLGYDLLHDISLFARIGETASVLNGFKHNPKDKAPALTPIFILGMPRSGTTLVEQIISCHSQVQDGGELKNLSRLGSAMAFGALPLTRDSIDDLRTKYLVDLSKISNGHKFVTDKMPQNFLCIGLILKAFPEAKIIHVKRDPAATCWSNFKHYFQEDGLGYSYDLVDTVGYFKLYRSLMKFWDQEYGDMIYHLDYEKLTANQGAETRQLVKHLGLEWEDACLSPHENKRNVRTSSQQQVRQKMYSGSSEVWRKFGPFLNGAFDELLDL